MDGLQGSRPQGGEHLCGGSDAQHCAGRQASGRFGLLSTSSLNRLLVNEGGEGNEGMK